MAFFINCIKHAINKKIGLFLYLLVDLLGKKTKLNIKKYNQKFIHTFINIII